MSVYFARVGGYIKIGWSDNPERRIDRLMSGATRYNRPAGCPTGKRHRELLTVIPGHTSQETACHMALDDFRVEGEFFVDEPPVREFIERAKVGDFTPVAREGGPVWVMPVEDEATREIIRHLFDRIAS